MELWDVYDINRKCTGKVIDRHSDEKLKEGEYHLVVEAIIVNSQEEILINKRSKFKNKYPNMWEFVGGSCIKGESSLEAILREVREELGIIFNESDAIFYKTLRDDNAKYFKDIWLLKKDFKIEDLIYTDGEVVDSKLVNIVEFENIKSTNVCVPTIKLNQEEFKNILEILNKNN